MSITKQKKKRAISETVAEPVAKVVTDHSPAKKQKKVGKKLEKTETKPVNGNASKAETTSPGETQLTAKQRKRLKTKERKLAAIAKIKEEGGVPKSIWSTKKEKKLKIEAQKGVEDAGKTVEKKKKNTKETDNEDKLKAKQAKRAETMKLRKEKRAQDGQYKVEQVTLSPEEIRLRIADIKNRGELTKTARRKLAVLTKKLGVLEGTAPTTVVAKKPTEKGLSKSEKRRLRREKKTPAEGDEAEAEKEEEDPTVEKPVDIQTFEKKKQKKVVKKEVAAVVKGGAKKPEKVDQKLAVAGNKPTGKKGKKVTPVSVIANEEEEEEEEDEEDEESDDESEADQEDEEMEASSDEEEEAEENGVNSSIQETEEDDEEEEEDEEDEDDDEEDDDEDEEEEKAEVVTKAKAPAAVKGSKEEAGGKKQKQKQEKGKNLKETSNGEQNSQKKKRYVLFVGNVPFDAKPDEIKTHFLTKVEKVSSVRIPTKPGTQVPRGIAYVEVLNDIDYEKGLSLHHSFLKGRRINVEYTMAGSKQVVNRQELVSKNQKLHAMRKAGQLAGSQKHDQKRSVRRFKKREQESKTKQD